MAASVLYGIALGVSETDGAGDSEAGVSGVGMAVGVAVTVTVW